MDIFSEQLERKDRGLGYIFKKIGLLLGALVLSVALVCFVIAINPFFAPMAFLAGFGLVYLGIVLSNNLDIEYEYIVTGTCLDVDKIIAMKKRKRLVSVDIPTFELFGKYDESVNLPDCDVTVEAIYSSTAPLYYAVFDDEKYGKTLLLFNPNEKTLDTVDTSLPRQFRVF